MPSDNDDSLYKTGSPLPGRQNNYETAYNEAAGKLSLLLIEKIAERSGADVIESEREKALSLNFIGDEILVTHPEISVSYRSGKADVPMWAKILILHYLVNAKGVPPTGRQVTFQQLEGGLGYYPAFQRRSIDPLLDTFSGFMDAFVKAGILAGGSEIAIGDYALTFRAFPRVEVKFVLWKGDEEFPPSGTVILDSSISDYLSTEDVAVLCNMIAVRIVKASQKVM
ncbi:MAG: DUF3786 domain-containing protein [Spirochaetes bacterium]|nr:DUF3786 domain-containing protein [Spirochaetota bacterium]